MSPTIIITGASRGIGLATAQFLLADGANVVAVQRSTTPELKALAEKYPKTLLIVQGDCTSEEIITHTISTTLKTFNKIDGVVFNAATNAHGVGPVASVPLEGWQRTFDVNVFGVVRFLQALLPVVKDGARVVFVSSAAAEFGVVAAGAYSASKAALNSINRTVAAENPGKIFVALHPGAVRTEMQHDFTVDAAAYVPESVMNNMYANLLEPAEPGRVISDLALRAGAELSGKYLHWNDPCLAGLRRGVQ